MSYDLYLAPKRFDSNALSKWFEDRRYYEVSELQAIYENARTGVYFILNFITDPEPDDLLRQPYVAVSLNLYRPHTFGLEAEPEIAAFLTHFDCDVYDPQIGIEASEYSRESFLRTWNDSNRYGFRAYGQQVGSEAPPPWPADPALIESIWRWNYDWPATQEAAGDDIFVPRINWYIPRGSGAPVPACVWTNHVPTMVPISIVTHVALVRERRRSLLGMLRSKSSSEKDLEATIDRVDGLRNLTGMKRSEAGGQAILLTPAAHPPDVQKRFVGNRLADAMTMIRTEEVCGADLVALMKGNR